MLVCFRLVISALVVISFVLPVQVHAVPSNKAIDVLQAQADSRDIRFYELPNQLKVLLISDPQVEKSAASLDVWVGSSDDPMDRQGLAHFLEHMLFLGTEKYPEADEYQDFINGHGGSHNAYTSSMHTNYFFDIEHAHFQPALDRFAQFFISPLFNEKYVERERNAVNSEYTAKYTDDYRRIRDVYREIAIPGHPLNHFSVGNLDTLQVEKPRNLRNDLIDFYNSHYSASRMSLVVIGREPLATLQEWVKPLFSRVPNKTLTEMPSFDGFVSQEELPLSVEIVPRREMRELSFVFAVPDSRAYYLQKPLNYVGFFLGHESEGSLLSVLKSKNWATALSAGSSFQWRGGDAFTVSITLTETGLQKQAEIQALLFDYVALLKNQGLEKWRYAEMQQLGELAFEYGDKQNPMSEVMRLSSGLHYYAPELALKAGYLYKHFDKKLLKTYLDRITPENMVRVLIAPGLSTDKVSEYYQTPYRVTPLAQPSIKSEELTQMSAALALPEENRFIPTDFSLFKNKAGSEVPLAVNAKKHLKLWYANDDRFDIPKSHVKIRLWVPSVAESIEGAVTARVYSAVTREMLNEISYTAAMAGLGFDIQASSRGIDLSFSGYNHRLENLVQAVVKELAKYNNKPAYRAAVHDRVFADIHSELLRNYNNAALDSPYLKLLKRLPALVFSPYWTSASFAETLQSFDRQDYESMLPRLLEGAEAEVLVFGNYRKKSAQKIARQVSRLALADKKQKTLPPNSVVNLSSLKKPMWKPVEVDHSDSGIAWYIQGNSDSIEENAKMLVLQQMLSTPFYATLRTEKQLGYIVAAYSYPIREVPGIVAVVQSPKASVETLDNEIKGFFESYQNVVLQNFERDKSAVLAVLAEQAKSQAELAGDYWQSIMSGDVKFDKKDRLIQAVQKIQPEDMQQYYRQQLVDGHSRVVVASESESETFFLGRYQKITDDSVFKASGPHYVYP